MASLFVRIREMVTAHAHHNLDEVENPKVMAQQMLRDLGKDLSRANRALVTALGAEKSLLRQQEHFQAEATDWERKAERLLKAGDEALVRAALERAIASRAHGEGLARPLEQARQTTARLREQVDRLKSEWETARARCAQIAASQNAAEVLGAARDLSDHYTRAMDRAQRLDQLSRRASAFECEAEAAAELMGDHDRLEREVARVDRSAEVEAALASLKARVETAAPPSS
ncbi:MAG TPA: PspA/IM30 family protein [Nevskiaceae bacterium]|nr:PspA/IM30 family protein [Nevskiaceae bacterium]